MEGDVKAHIDGAAINASGGVGVSAADTDQTTATTYCMVFGLLFSSLSNHANATLTPAVDAWINGAQIQAGGNVAVTADAETTAAASVVGRSIGILSAGPSASNATDSPLVNSYIGASSSIVAAGTINVQGMHNTGAGIGATASADSPSYGVVGASGATPQATQDAVVDVYVSPGGVLQAGGNITLTADSNNYGDAEADSFFAGVLGAGTSDPSTTVDSQTMAHMDGTITGGQSLTILRRPLVWERPMGLPAAAHCWAAWASIRRRPCRP